MATEKKITLPDLTRAKKTKGLVHQDFSIRKTFEKIDSRFNRRGRYYPNSDYTERLFLRYYNTENAIYRSDFLEEWLDNKQTRKELDQIVRSLPDEKLSLVIPHEQDERRESSDESIKKQIRLVKKYLSLPETFENVIEFSGSSQAAKDLIRFSKKARRELETFVQSVTPIKNDPQYNDKSTIDYGWANKCIGEIREFSNLLDDLRGIRFKLNYYRQMCIPFEYEFKGQRIPICKPIYLDPEQKEGHIREAYNPRFFEFEEQRQGKKWKRIIKRLNVPNDIDWDSRHRHIYVYGPNDMGKSVYLNTAALNIHLAMNGSYCFADSCKISLPGRLYPCLDLGDTVGSGHFVTGAEKINQMLEEVLKDDIVFLDEHAGGAEPDQERIISKGITNALTKHSITFFYATNDKKSWSHKIGNERREVLRVADYDDQKRKYKVWPGIANAGYSMIKAKEMGIDPESAEKRLDERLMDIYSYLNASTGFSLDAL